MYPISIFEPVAQCICVLVSSRHYYHLLHRTPGLTETNLHKPLPTPKFPPQSSYQELSTLFPGTQNKSFMRPKTPCPGTHITHQSLQTKWLTFQQIQDLKPFARTKKTEEKPFPTVYLPYTRTTECLRNLISNVSPYHLRK